VSDYNPFTSEGDPSPVDDGPEIGVAEGDGQPTEPAPEEVYEPRDYLDIDEVGDRYVAVKVDGEQLEVPLREALQGYSRTSDYTRKTQEVAEKAKQAEYALAVQRALQAQPEETLRLLGRQYGVNFESQSPPPAPMGERWEQPSYDDGGYESDDPYADPVQKRLNQQDRILQDMQRREQEREANETLRAAVGGLQRKYQLDETTVQEVVSTALQAGMGPGAFEMIYKNIAFDRAQRARELAMQQRTEQNAAREAAKARGQQLVGYGPSAAAAGGPPPVPSEGRPISLSEAFEAAWDQHTR
jgi:hypothetical protein